MLRCYLTRRHLGAYLDGALEPARAHRTARHVEACAACRAEVAALARLRGLVREALAVPAPDWTGFWPGVVRGIEAARHRTPVPARRPLPLLARPRLAVGGVLAAVLALSLTLWQALDTGLGPTAPGPVIVSANTELPDATVMVYSVPEQELAVVWLLDGDANAP